MGFGFLVILEREVLIEGYGYPAMDTVVLLTWLVEGEVVEGDVVRMTEDRYGGSRGKGV